MRASSVLSPRQGHRRRGGVLITALIFSAIIALAIPGFFLLSRSALKLSHRGFYNTAAVDLAETGLEHAMWSLNAASQGTGGAWTGWDTTSSPGDARRRFSNFTYTGGVTGYVNVHVAGYAAAGASAVARAVIQVSPTETVEKWMRITTKGRSLFEYGLLAREKFSAGGGNVFDSWISDPDGDPSTAPVPYSSGVARSNGSVATTSTDTPAIELNGSAKVYGKVAVGTSTGATIVYGALGGSSTGWNPTSVNWQAGLRQNWGSTVGQIGDPSEYIREGHLLTGFTATFETPTAPEVNVVRAPYTVPFSYDDPSTTWNDNIYVNGKDSRYPATLGTAGVSTVIQMDKLTVKADAKLTVLGNVTLVLPPQGITTFEVIAGGSLVLADGATLTVYTPGNISVTGAGTAAVLGSSSPADFQIWSTRGTGSIGQTITLAGSGSLSGVIYAPEASFTVPGGTHFYGAAVVRSFSMSGSGSIHYDESLKKLGSSNGGAVGIDSYAELDSDAKRSTYATQLAF